MSILCRFYHKNKVIKIKNYIDVSYGEAAKSTMVVYKCSRCKKIYKKTHYGIELTMDDVI